MAQVPSGVLPGQIERAQVSPREPQLPVDIPAAPPGSQSPPANAANIRFRLNALVVEGATVYPAEELQKAFASAVGTEVSLERIYAIAAALTARYRNDGYVLSQVIVPAQSVKDGKLTLQAVEGYVSQVHLQGAPGLQASVAGFA
ncbi:MAG: ShlB/FhaC/HecB family hemolysin secretion/activation protein, partial [Rhodoferax sp.]|nr:ShlB/FhaC/HecB family hemolysin secretion/activation protein [Rhodoferax sp.]